MGVNRSLFHRLRSNCPITSMALGAFSIGSLFTYPVRAAEQIYEYQIVDANYGNIGTYNFKVETNAAGRFISTEAHIKVTVLGITVYRQEAARTEHWIDGRIVDFHGVTTENGKSVAIDGRSQEGNFVIATPSGETTAPATIRPISPWSVSIPGGGDVMFMPDTGKIAKVLVRDESESSVISSGAATQIRHYSIQTNDGSEHYEVWASSDGTPLKFTIRDEQGDDTFTLVK